MATEFVGIELQLRGEEAVMAKLREADAMIKSLRGRKQLELNLTQAKRELDILNAKMKEFRNMQKELASQGKKSPWVDANIKKTQAEIDKVTSSIRVMQASLRTAGKTFAQTFNSMSSRVAHVGSAMQSLGNAMTRMTAPFRMLTTGLLYGAGFKALNLITDGFSKAFERSDTMDTYDRSLKALGLDAEKTFSIAGKAAKTAKENLDEAVQGLPTGLDEIMAAQKVYAGATGEMVKSTETAIAANNAFIASAMDAREQRFMQRYLVALASGAELTTMQWQSMARIAPLAMRAVSKELGYADDEYKQFTADVQSGAIAGEDFLKAFNKVGTSGSVARAARVTAMTWRGLASNITIATARMGQGLIKTVNEVFEKSTGRNLIQHLLGYDAQGNEIGGGIKHWINDLSESVQDWIKANPDAILGFFERLKSVDWKGLLKGVVEGVSTVAKQMASLARTFGKVGKALGIDSKGLKSFGKWYTQMALYGRGLTILGGLLKGGRHPIALLLTFLNRATKRLPDGGIFEMLGKLFGSKGAIDSAGDAAKSVPTVAGTFRNAFSALQGLITAAGAVTLVAGTGVIAFASVKQMLKDLKAIGDLLKDMTWMDAVTGANIILSIGVMAKVLEYVGKTFGLEGLKDIGIASGAGLLVGGAFAGIMWEIKTALGQLKEAIVAIKDIGNELSTFEVPEFDVGKITETIGKIDEVYAALSGQGQQTTGSRIGRALGFFKNPLGSLLGGLGKGAADAMQAGAMASKFSSLLGTIKSLKKVTSEINSLGSVTINEGAVANITTITDSIGTVFDKIAEVMPKKGKAINLAGSATGLANALYQMRRMAYSINQLAGTSLNTSGFETFIKQLKTALEDLKSVSGDLELKIKVTMSKAFESSVKAVIKRIKKGKSDIKAQNKPISVNIPVVVTFSVSTNLGSALSIIWSAIASIKAAASSGGSSSATYSGGNGGGGSGGGSWATGGMIYRANGGSIYRAGGGSMFRPRGTDRVPAMLTPGEFVQNKRAVNFFGIDFMRKVNSLDMKGAMDELMIRAGNMVGAGQSTTINNYYNNNQKVVQNISTNSPDFAFRTASRFVGAF